MCCGILQYFDEGNAAKNSHGGQNCQNNFMTVFPNKKSETLKHCGNFFGVPLPSLRKDAQVIQITLLGQVTGPFMIMIGPIL